MSRGSCPNCGKENLKNIEVHMRYCKKRLGTNDPGICLGCGHAFDDVEAHKKTCKLTHEMDERVNKAMKQEAVLELLTSYPNETPVDKNVIIHKPSLKERIFNRGKRPIIINKPDPNYSDAGLTEQQKITNLLKDAPLWTKYKPKGIGAKITKIMNPGVSFASCVFVSEHSQPKILYLPYEPEKNRLIIPDKGFYIPSQTAPPFFFHEDYCLELIHTPALKDKFNIPAHVIQAKYNAGLMEGTLKSGKELLDEIKKYKMVCYLLGIIVLVALVALIGVSYTYDKNYKAIAEQTNNLTNAISNMRRLP